MILVLKALLNTLALKILASGLLLVLTFPAAAADWLALDHFNLIDGTGKPPRPVARMLIKDGRITALSNTDTTSGQPAILPERQPFDRWTQIDLGGAWVMPGLIDTHVHVARFPDAHNEAERILRAALRGGITSVRDLGGDARSLADLKHTLGREPGSGPTVVFSAIYGGPNLFEDQRITGFAGGYPPGGAPWAYAVDGSTNLPLAIAASKGSGVDGIKIYGNLNVTHTNAIIAAAHQQGLRTWAHASVFPAGPQHLVAAGVDSLSHAPYLIWAAVDEIPADYSARTQGPWDTIPADHPRLIELYQAMAEGNISLDATLYVYEQMQNFSPQVDASWAGAAAAWAAQAVAAAHHHGVPITTGTDWFEPRPGELPHTHAELALLVEKAGLSPMQAIIAATRNSAAALGLADERGTLETGKAADLLVLEKNPLDDVRNTESLRLVVKDGVLVQPLSP